MLLLNYRSEDNVIIEQKEYSGESAEEHNNEATIKRARTRSFQDVPAVFVSISKG